MSSTQTPGHHASVERFWDNYLFILEKNNIPKNSLPWYRKHIEAYIKANKGTLLSGQTGEDVDHYLNAKGRLPGYPGTLYLLKQLVLAKVYE